MSFVRFAAAGLLLLNACGAMPNSTVQAMPSRSVRSALLPDADIKPANPEQGLDADHRGYVVVEYDVGDDGRTENVRIAFAHPPDLFDRVALEAIRTMRFDPLPDQRDKLRTKFAFYVSSGGRITIDSTFIRCQGQPFVEVEFDVDAEGIPVAPRVVGACPKGIYERMALRLVEQRRYSGPQTGVRTRLTFGERW